MRNLKSMAILLLSISVFISCASLTKPKKNIDQLVAKMTLKEKVDFIGGYNGFYVRGYEHLGIPEIRMADGPVGVRNLGPSTSYPASITLAASFDKAMAKKVGKAIGSEARSKNVHIMLGPAMNIHRGPFCGRNFEYLGEDPYLAGKIAANYTLGLQGEGVIATAKHYVANYQDFNRHRVSSDMDERTLHEIYLPAFKTTVLEGKVAAVMTAYNLINGVHASQNDYLNNEILKEKWRFDGFIMSDWVSTYDGLACAKGGLDLEMPSGKYMSPDTLIPAIENGLIEETLIDEKIKRILGVYDRFGLFEKSNIADGYILDSAMVRSVALDAARGGIVLLKNGNKFLPLNKNEIKSVVVIGPNGHPAVTGGGGSSFVRPLHSLSVYEALKQKLGNNVDVSFEKGVYTGERLPEDFFDDFNFYIKENGEKKSGVEAEFYGNTKLKGEIVATTVFDKLNLETKDMVLEGVPKEDFSTRFTCYFSPEETGAYWLAVAGDDGYRMFIDDEMVFELWQNQGETISKYEGDFKKGKEYKIVVEYYQGGGDAVIRLAAQKRIGKSMNPKDYMDEAVAAAQKSDVAVVCVGFSNENETEGSDRTFEMPFKQAELIQNISKVNSNVIVVLNAGGNVEMNSWIGGVKGLLHAWYSGQEGAIAVAEILLGETNPSGKLPVSFEAKWEDNPTYKSYSDDDEDLKVYFKEGIFMGYRYWDKATVKPNFPFGFGLSYTTFDCSNLKMNKTTFNSDETVQFTVDVTNTGNADGAEVVQVYVSDKVSKLLRPVKELKDFDKVFLKKGESKTIQFELNKDAFSYYDPEIHDWTLEPGEFEILVGNSSDNILQKVNVIIK